MDICELQLILFDCIPITDLFIKLKGHNWVHFAHRLQCNVTMKCNVTMNSNFAILKIKNFFN